ncbi:MAG TPA: hypothetical protein VFT46_11390 [Holophagaceae bacterium]|nr:hypothetical protein [Holophagaceae bacterium]
MRLAGSILLALLALRTLMLAVRAAQGRLPWTRLLVPAALLVEGLGLRFGAVPGAWKALKAGTALVLELGLLALMAHRFWRLPLEPGVLPEDHLAKPLEAFLSPRLARILALEVVLLGSALRFLAGGWRRPDPPGFSYHRSSAFAAILPALPLLVVGDLVLVEVLLRSVAPWIRLLVHALDAYGVLWVLGLWASFRARPHRIEGDVLHLHKGLLSRAEIPLSAIQRVGPVPRFDDDWARLRFHRGALAFQAPGAPDLVLDLDRPAAAVGLLGPGRPKARVVLSADDLPALRSALEGAAV